MDANWPGVLVAIAPFAVLAFFGVVAWRRANADRQQVIQFGRQAGGHSNEVVAALKENNALLREVIARLDQLEKRSR